MCKSTRLSREGTARKALPLLLACCCSILAMWACVGANAQEQGEITPGNGSVAGHVFCSDTQKPARFAQVRLIRAADGARGFGGGNTGVTTADGSFSIGNVPPGDYFVSAQMPGYIDPLRSLGLRGLRQGAALPEAVKAMLTKVTVAADQSATVQVTAFRGAVLAGTLTYDDGTPAAGIPVSAQRMEDSNADGDISESGGRDLAFTNSGDRGDFRLGGLPDGVYILRARPRGSNGPGTLPIYYGNTLRKSEARRLEIKAGEERSGLDIQIPALSLRQVSGVVQAAKDGHGIGRATVSLTLNGESSEALNTISGPDGGFRFVGVPNGKFTVRVSGASDAAAGHGAAGDTTESVVPYGPDEQNIELNGSDVDHVILSLPALNAQGSANP